MKRSKKLISFKVELIKKRYSDRNMFSKLKNHFNYIQIKAILEEIKAGKLRGYDYIYRNVLPKEYDDLMKSELLLIGDNFKNELVWNFLLISDYAEVINRFSELKDKFEVNFINGNYVEAERILNLVEENISVSIWTLENRFLLEEYKGGVEKNKEFLSNLNKLNVDEVLLYIADFSSFKAEKNTSAAQFHNRFNKFINNIDYDKIESYFKFKLNILSQFTYEEYKDILWIESKASIIDRYISLIKICQQLMSVRIDDEQIKEIIHKNIENLSWIINDSSIQNLLILFNPKLDLSNNKKSEQMIKIGDLYTLGQYGESYNASKCLLDEHSNCIELYEYNVKSLIFADNSIDNLIHEHSIKNQIITSMFHAYCKNINSIENYKKIYKIALSLSHMNLGYQLYNFLINRYAISKDSYFTILSELNTKFLNPRFSSVFKGSIGESLDYLQAIGNTFTNSTLIGFYRWYYEQLDSKNVTNEDERVKSVPLNRILRYKALTYNELGNDDLALDIYKDILESHLNNVNLNEYRYLYEKIIVEMYNLYLSTNRIAECIELFVDNYLKDSDLTLRMDLELLIDFIDNATTYDKNDLQDNIALPILFNIFYKNQFNYVYTAYANFMDKINVSKPSLLMDNSFQINNDRLVYFLRHVCSIDVMDYAVLGFNNPEEVREERVEICQILIKIDPINESEYVKEISQIKQKLRINKKVQQIDESRIEVNVNGIKYNQNALYKESFNRYKELGDLVKNLKTIDISNVKNLLSFNKDSNLTKQTNLLNQKYALLKESILEIRDQFLFNEKYGLDSSLSTRIRHGALMNEIRSTFHSNELILSKHDEHSQSYDLNNYWERKLINSDISFVKEFKRSLGNFSSKIDEKINEINQEWIKIKTESKNSKGLFDYTLTDKQLLIYFQVFEEYNAYELDSDSFFDNVQLVLWKITDDCLKKIREKFKTELNQEFLKYLHELEEEMVRLGDQFPNERLLVEVIKKIANCRTDIQNKMHKISDWFKVSDNKGDGDFDANLLVDTCIETIQSLNPLNKNININSIINCNSLFMGITFTYFFDILRILFDNAIEHSGFNDKKELKINLSILEDESKISIIMENNISKSKLLAEIQQAIDNIYRKIQDEKAIREFTAKEGGSGYAKISKILTTNLQCKALLSLTVIKHENIDFFRVKIEFFKENIVSVGRGTQTSEYTSG